jgi:hypothetical protein
MEVTTKTPQADAPRVVIGIDSLPMELRHRLLALVLKDFSGDESADISSEDEDESAEAPSEQDSVAQGDCT